MFVIWKTKHRHDVCCPQTDRFNAIPIKILSASFVFVEIDKNILKCMWMEKGIRVLFQNNFENNTDLGTQSLEFQNLVVVIIGKPVWYLQKDRHMEQKRAKNPEVVPTDRPI